MSRLVFNPLTGKMDYVGEGGGSSSEVTFPYLAEHYVSKESLSLYSPISLYVIEDLNHGGSRAVISGSSAIVYCKENERLYIDVGLSMSSTPLTSIIFQLPTPVRPTATFEMLLSFASKLTSLNFTTDGGEILWAKQLALSENKTYAITIESNTIAPGRVIYNAMYAEFNN